jgi:glyoxylase-like metal-dependent hydrolase (beta-lactamase superfamily II)
MQIGDLWLHAVSDGTFVSKPGYFGQHVSSDAHPEFFDRDHGAWLPIGCFVVRVHDRIVLVDAGLGPDRLGDGATLELVGGQLLTGLRAIGVTPSDITDVICSHFHADHVGWLFDLDRQPIFTRADIWFGAPDWDHFVTGDGGMRPHIQQGLSAHADRVRPITGDTIVAPGVTAVSAAGHTPGHLCVVLSSGTERALLLGDAITCPIQLDEPSWQAVSDVDPALAKRTRERLWRELEDDATVGVGAHFPELRFGRVLPTTVRRRWLI